MRILLSTGGEPGARPRNITRKDILVIATPCAPGEIDRPAVSVAALGGFQRRDAETQIKVAAKSWKNGYVLEIAIPFRLVSFKPGKGREVGISIMADDADQLHRQSVAMIRLENFTYWRSPAATGKAILK
jgi:hypothetical protein